MFEFQAALGRGCDNSDYYQDDMQGRGGWKGRGKVGTRLNGSKGGG